MLIASVLGIIAIVWLISRKFKCYHINQLIGKQWANSEDLERVNVKQSPSDGEATEMSAFLKERNVSDELEGQQISFKWTDATLAWAEGPKMST